MIRSHPGSFYPTVRWSVTVQHPDLSSHGATAAPVRPRLFFSEEQVIQMIEPELAKRFIEQLTQYTEYNINVMNESGLIIASRDPARIGTYHEAANLVISGRQDRIDVVDDTTYPGVLPGINMAIMVDGKQEGVIGVSGDPEKIREVAMITRIAFEAMLKYEKQQQKLQLRRNRKEHFITLLTQSEHAAPAEIRAIAGQLGYREDIVRIPILCRIHHGKQDPGTTDSGNTATPPPSIDPEKILSRIRAERSHNLQDFSCVLDEAHFIIFKTVDLEKRRSLQESREILLDYLEGTLQWVNRQEIFVTFYIGSFQNAFTQYYYAYQHCLWMESFLKNPSETEFFPDYAGEYFRLLLPRKELQHFLQVPVSNMQEGFLEQYVEIMHALIDTNYNLAEAARMLYLHKNTITYRYNKIKDYFGMDPLSSPSDRRFMELLYIYLTK